VRLAQQAAVYARTLGRLAWIFSVGACRRDNRRLIKRLSFLLGAAAGDRMFRPYVEQGAPSPPGPAAGGGAHGWVRPEVDRSLDEIALACGTDKASDGHGYTRCYEQELGHRRDAPLRLLEIGVLDGASLRAWRRYFPRATVHGIDLDPRCAVHEGVFIGSQGDPAFLREVAARAGPFDVVIDDGSHLGHDVLASMLALWPHVRPGGCYVIEDLHAAYWEAEWTGRGAMPLLFELVDCCMKRGKLAFGSLDSPRNTPGARASLTRLEREVDAVRLYPSIAFVWKRGAA
jgi:methyltransferase family protein